MAKLKLSDQVRQQLTEVLLEDRDLEASLRGQRPEEVPDSPGLYRCSCTLAVRRPLDPETSELREVEVALRSVEGGFEAFELKGLEGVAEQFES